MKQALKALKRLSVKKKSMDETAYIMSSPAMVEILREGDKEIEEGNLHPIKIDDLWK